MNPSAEFKGCFVIPVYNHEDTLQLLVPALLKKNVPIILVDDGSRIDCRKALEHLSAVHKSVTLVQLNENQGKGKAVKTGLAKAQAMGLSHALQIDADGQHSIQDIDRFMAVAKAHPNSLIVGCPIYDATVPLVRLVARYLTHVWVWINTLSMKVKDSMCGFRVYPLQGICRLLEEEFTGNRMEFDSEVIVRWVWREGAIVNLPTKVNYPENGVSHFLLLKDNLLISCMHTRLFVGMLFRVPGWSLRACFRLLRPGYEK